MCTCSSCSQLPKLHGHFSNCIRVCVFVFIPRPGPGSRPGPGTPRSEVVQVPSGPMNSYNDPNLESFDSYIFQPNRTNICQKSKPPPPPIRRCFVIHQFKAHIPYPRAIFKMVLPIKWWVLHWATYDDLRLNSGVLKMHFCQPPAPFHFVDCLSRFGYPKA